MGKQRTVYAKSLTELRKMEKSLMRDQLDGLDMYTAGHANVNFLFDRYISTESELRSSTYPDDEAVEQIKP